MKLVKICKIVSILFTPPLIISCIFSQSRDIRLFAFQGLVKMLMYLQYLQYFILYLWVQNCISFHDSTCSFPDFWDWKENLYVNFPKYNQTGVGGLLNSCDWEWLILIDSYIDVVLDWMYATGFLSSSSLCTVFPSERTAESFVWEKVLSFWYLYLVKYLWSIKRIWPNVTACKKICKFIFKGTYTKKFVKWKTKVFCKIYISPLS